MCSVFFQQLIRIGLYKRSLVSLHLWKKETSLFLTSKHRDRRIVCSVYAKELWKILYSMWQSVFNSSKWQLHYHKNVEETLNQYWKKIMQNSVDIVQRWRWSVENYLIDSCQKSYERQYFLRNIQGILG